MKPSSQRFSKRWARRRILRGETVLITAGPTREKIDPARYLTNRSSGRMGYAVAEAALRRGARVLAGQRTDGAYAAGSGRTHARGIGRADARCRAQSSAAGDHRHQNCCGLRLPREVGPRQKIKRKGPITLELEPTADILKEISLRKQSQIVVGFAAETENVLENARQKLAAKHLDAIVVNDVSREGIGFDSDRNEVTIITHDEVVEVPETTKWEVAQRVLDQVVRMRQRRKSPVKA